MPRKIDDDRPEPCRRAHYRLATWARDVYGGALLLLLVGAVGWVAMAGFGR